MRLGIQCVGKQREKWIHGEVSDPDAKRVRNKPKQKVNGNSPGERQKVEYCFDLQTMFAVTEL